MMKLFERNGRNFAGAIFLIGFFAFYLYTVANPVGQPEAPRTGAATAQLGEMGTPLSTRDQARRLLELIDERPEKNSYQVSYSIDGGELVLFGCDFNKKTVVRMHNLADGHGTAESWHGHLLHRLESAAAGGSLNDTPDGSRPGTFARF